MRFCVVVACTVLAGHLTVATSATSHHRHQHHHHHGAAFLDTGTRHRSAWREREAVDAALGVNHQRPIITGCLKECGYEEQTCVTACQVCIEQNECRILHQCDPCLEAARAQRMTSGKADQGILDSGGVAMIRDGLLALMTRARMEALDRKRDLRTARQGVLQAQREAEWATQERTLSAKNLEDARQGLKGARLEVTRWKLQNEKKVKVLRAKAREQRQDRRKAEQKLDAAKRKHAKAQHRLRIATASSANSTEDNLADVNVTEDEDQIWKLAQEAEDKQEAVKRAEKDLETTKVEGEWLDRGLRRRVEGARTGAAQSREELLEGRARERVSSSALEEAKDHYVKAVKSSQYADKAAKEAEEKLRNAPLTDKEKKDGKKDSKDATPHSAASRLAGVHWLQPLFLLVFSIVCTV